MNWISIGSLSDIPRRGARCVDTPQGKIAVFRTADDQVYAIDDHCPHKGGPLSQGIVHGAAVTCPLHNWVISLETGKALGAKEVFGKLPEALLDKCVAAYEKKQDLGEMKLAIDGTRFDLTPKGVHFYGADYPHVIAALTGNGPIVPWGALLREKALRSDSPAKRLWQSVKAATDTKGDCVLDDDMK